MDPEIRDEMERRGDSLLDEERWRRESYSMTATTLDGEPALALLLRRAIFTVDQAVLIAHAILSEAEIIQRGESHAD